MFVHKVHTIYAVPAVALVEAHLRRQPPPTLVGVAVPPFMGHVVFKLLLVVSALISLILEEMRDTRQLSLHLCRFYLRFSSFAVMELYLNYSRRLLLNLRQLARSLHGGPVVSSISGGLLVSRYRQLIEKKAAARDATRWLNRSFGSQLLMFYADTAVNLSCLAGELIILVHRDAGSVWIAVPRVVECVFALLLSVFMANIGSEVSATCLQAADHIGGESNLADEVRAVFSYRPEWDGLRIIDSTPHNLPTVAGAVVNIVTFVAIVLQFDVTVNEAVYATGTAPANCTPLPGLCVWEPAHSFGRPYTSTVSTVKEMNSSKPCLLESAYENCTCRFAGTRTQ